MKTLFASLLCFAVWFVSLGSVFETSFAIESVKVTQNDLLIGGGVNSANSSTNITIQENFLKNIQRYMMGLVGIVSVGVFLYIGYTLFTAQWHEENFKNAWKALIYAIIGLAIMPLAFIAVKIITGFTF